MRRTPLQRRTPLRTRPKAHEPAVEKEPRPLAKATRRANYGGSVSGVAVNKDVPGRNPTLLEMARGRRCLLLAVSSCHMLRGDTTVACHQNEGKGMALKRPDEYSVWGCAACHEWLDRSSAPRAEKRRAFDAAHLRQRAMWERVAADPGEPERYRKAARWALDQLKERT